MTAEALLTYAGNLGFPAFLAIYLLVRFESKLDNLTRAVASLDEVFKIEPESLPKT